MTDASKRRAANAIVLVGAISLFGGCDATTEPRVVSVPATALTAKATGVTVTATEPSFGAQGQSNEAVTITGTGFEPGAQASWLRNGAVDPTITVASTQYVSSTKLIATISISPNSPVDYRDVQVVTRGRTQGIGSLMFEVTQAVQIPGTSWARSINDNGEATGTLTNGGVFYYSIGTAQLETVSPTGTGYDISAAGTAIVGSGGPAGGLPYLYTRTGPAGAWVGTPLPLGSTSTSGIARSMRTDGSGQVLQIGGVEFGGVGAVTWTWQAATSSWQRTVLPGGNTEVRHRALGDNGVLGGTAAAGRFLGPAVWMPNGAGGYALTVLAAKNGAINGVRSDGGMLVGFTSSPSASAPMYWTAQPGGTWGAPVTVAGGCFAIKDISDAGRFVLTDCPFSNGNRVSSAYADAPYSSLSRLGGLGPNTFGGFASGISHGGHYAAGYAGSVGVYWQLP